MKKKIITIPLTIAFMGLFLSKTTAQTHLDLNRLPLENRLLKGGDSIMQKKNLFFIPHRDVTQKRNLLYLPSVDGKPTFKLLDNNTALEFGSIKTIIAK